MLYIGSSVSIIMIIISIIVISSSTGTGAAGIYWKYFSGESEEESEEESEAKAALLATTQAAALAEAVAEAKAAAEAIAKKEKEELLASKAEDKRIADEEAKAAAEAAATKAAEAAAAAKVTQDALDKLQEEKEEAEEAAAQLKAETEKTEKDLEFLDTLDPSSLTPAQQAAQKNRKETKEKELRRQKRQKDLEESKKKEQEELEKQLRAKIAEENLIAAEQKAQEEKRAAEEAEELKKIEEENAEALAATNDQLKKIKEENAEALAAAKDELKKIKEENAEALVAAKKEVDDYKKLRDENERVERATLEAKTAKDQNTEDLKRYSKLKGHAGKKYRRIFLVKNSTKKVYEYKNYSAKYSTTQSGTADAMGSSGRVIQAGWGWGHLIGIGTDKYPYISAIYSGNKNFKKMRTNKHLTYVAPSYPDSRGRGMLGINNNSELMKAGEVGAGSGKYVFSTTWSNIGDMKKPINSVSIGPRGSAFIVTKSNNIHNYNYPGWSGERYIKSNVRIHQMVVGWGRMPNGNGKVSLVGVGTDGYVYRADHIPQFRNIKWSKMSHLGSGWISIGHS